MNKMLVIDDDPMIHKMLDFSLKDQKVTIEHCNNAIEAQEFLTKNGQELSAMVLDWEMPGMTGIEFLEWIKSEKRYKDIPVIMLTSNDRKADVKRGIDAGAYYYLIKPFNKDLLISIVNAAIFDFNNVTSLNHKVKEAQNPFTNLVNGKFLIKHLEDAERMSVYIANSCPNPEEALIISELLNNAIEHGNLGITYDEKSKLIDDDKLFSEIDRRLKLKAFADKFAEVLYTKNDAYILVRIEDQGKGFDYQKYLHFDESRVFDNHGRGIAMVNSVMNVQYHGKGNVVEVKIPLNSKA
ncbi:MAG: response regulator [Chitinophagales bacterium]